jgi:hypothetical protein
MPRIRRRKKPPLIGPEVRQKLASIALEEEGQPRAYYHPKSQPSAQQKHPYAWELPPEK